MGNKNSFKNEISWSNVRLQVGLVFPHTQHLENKSLRIRNNLVHCSKGTWDM